MDNEEDSSGKKRSHFTKGEQPKAKTVLEQVIEEKEGLMEEELPEQDTLPEEDATGPIIPEEPQQATEEVPAMETEPVAEAPEVPGTRARTADKARILYFTETIARFQDNPPEFAPNGDALFEDVWRIKYDRNYTRISVFQDKRPLANRDLVIEVLTLSSKELGREDFEKRFVKRLGQESADATSRKSPFYRATCYVSGSWSGSICDFVREFSHGKTAFLLYSLDDDTLTYNIDDSGASYIATWLEPGHEPVKLLDEARRVASDSKSSMVSPEALAERAGLSRAGALRFLKDLESNGKVVEVDGRYGFIEK